MPNAKQASKQASAAPRRATVRQAQEMQQKTKQIQKKQKQKRKRKEPWYKTILNPRTPSQPV
jgi:hypothetical protein